jgi:hypothetical protein
MRIVSINLRKRANDSLTSAKFQRWLAGIAPSVLMTQEAVAPRAARVLLQVNDRRPDAVMEALGGGVYIA